MQHNIRYRGGWQAPAMCTGQALSVNVYNPPLSSVLLGVTLIRLNGIYHCRVWSASIIKPPLSRWQLPGPSSGVAPELSCNPTSAPLPSAFLLANFWGGGRRPDSLRKQFGESIAFIGAGGNQISSVIKRAPPRQVTKSTANC